ncbi:hypothetical protein ACOI1C_05815 [Bacillus sp. DJP31]|uniref:hypothetical protein n=1 Tax=Bacillus sp. DJP31 TaxID=3409789 RepID=UPI003BB58F10
MNTLKESVQKGGQKEQRSSRKRSLELPARMFCIREERRDELTKKFEAIFAGLFEHPLKLFYAKSTFDSGCVCGIRVSIFR